MPRGEARGQNLVHLQNVVFLRQSILEDHILTTTCHVLTTTDQKALIIGPKVTWRTPKVLAVGVGGRATGQNLVQL